MTKRCSMCKEELAISLFSADKSRGDGLSARCRACDTEYARKKRAQNPSRNRNNVAKYREKNRVELVEKVKRYNKAARNSKNPQFYATRRRLHAARKLLAKQACPIWADKGAIEEVYLTAAEHNIINPDAIVHVDHIVPLKHKLVCGLHIADNMQLLPAVENMRKRNSFWPDMP